MPTPDELLKVRAGLIDKGRGLTYTGEDSIPPDTRIYVIDFNSEAGLLLTRSGKYQGPSHGTHAFTFGYSQSGIPLVEIIWYGDGNKRSVHPVDRLGINAKINDGSTLLAVSSLEELGLYSLVDRRHLKQRNAHPLNPT